MKNSDVCKNFVNGVISKTKHLFIEKSRNGVIVLYSYGYHFPLGIKLIDNNFLVNQNRYSNTTSRHKSNLLNCLNKDNILFCNTEKLKEIIDKGFKTITEISEDKI